MTKENITYIIGASLVTCVVPIGKGDDVLKVAREVGVSGGIVYHGKGTGVRERVPGRCHAEDRRGSGGLRPGEVYRLPLLSCRVSL